MNPQEEKIRIGYGEKTTELPLRAKSFNFGNSKTIKQIQVVDIFTGSYFLWLRGQCNAKHRDDLWTSLDIRILENNLIIDSISPSDKFDLFKDRRKRPGDINPNDYVTRLFVKRRYGE